MTTTLNGSTTELTAKPITVLCWKCQCNVTTALSLANYHVLWKGNDIGATRAEYRVIRLLYTKADQFVTYRELYDVVQSPGFVAGDGVWGMQGNVRSLIKRVRQKFVKIGSKPDVIENLPGIGYRWKGDNA